MLKVSIPQDIANKIKQVSTEKKMSESSIGFCWNHLDQTRQEEPS